MSAEHYRTPVDGIRSGEITRNFLHGVSEFGRATIALAGIAVSGIPDVVRNITSKEPVPSSVNIPASPYLFYRD